MKKKTFLLLFVIYIMTNISFGQEKELFIGENKLSSCKADIPLSYSSKERQMYIDKAKKYKDIELVFLTYNKKSKSMSYSTYFIIVDERFDKTFVYFETPENHNKISGNKQAIFRATNTNKNRYYTLECFDKILEENPELKELMIKE